MTSCPLCNAQGENVLWHDGLCRVVLVDDPDYPGYCRVIWNEHVKEMTDLSAAERAHIIEAVLAVEDVLRSQLHPDKINLASLGNQVPHLHWHVIPRFVDDAKFPDAIWAPGRRDGVRRNADVAAIAASIRKHMEGRK